MSTPRQSFKTFFCAQDGGVLLKSASISGSLQNSGIRSIAWMYFLGVFENGSPEKLIEDVRKNRTEYKNFVQQHIIDPRTLQEHDPTFNNPLSQVADSPWAKFFQNVELEKEINQDIERCYPDKEFFQHTTTRDMMSRILFVYSKLNASLSYRQGMHELLAPIVYLLHKERNASVKDNDPDDAQANLGTAHAEILASLRDPEFIEADAFYIFKNLMNITREWYSGPGNSAKKGAAATPPQPNDETRETTVVIKCRRIQHVLLKNKDPELHAHLESLKIEPQFYLIRWVRLLLGREFHLDDLVIIWDAVFAHSPDLVLIDYVCVAMLVFIREQLLERDYSGCLTRLMRYPPVEDVRLFIEQAQTLISNRMQKQQPQQSPQMPHQHHAHQSQLLQTPLHPLSDVTPSLPPASSPASPSSTKKSRFKKDKRASASTASSSSTASVSGSNGSSAPGKVLQTLSTTATPLKHMLNVDTSSTDIEQLQDQLRTLRDTQLAVAQRIDSIVHTIQDTIMNYATPLTNTDSLMVSIAELKQAKDILCGYLPATEWVENLGEEEPEVDVVDNPLISDPLTKQIS